MRKTTIAPQVWITLSLLALALLSSALPSVAQAQSARKPGLYEITSTMSMGGQSMPAAPQLPPGVKLPPGVQMPQGSSMGGPRTSQVCVTQAMIDKYGGPSPAPQRGNCQVTDISMKPDGMTAKLSCSGQMTGTGTIETTFIDATTSQTKVHITGTMQMGSNSRPVDMTVESKAVYKGSDCGDVQPPALPPS
jgi:hypothetical protein